MKRSVLPDPRPKTALASWRRAPRGLVPAVLLAITLAGARAAATLPSPPEVSAQGLFATSPGRAASPRGDYRMEYSLYAAPQNRLLADVVVTTAHGRWQLRAIPGPALFVSDLGRIVSLESFDPPEIPATLRVYDLDGREVHSARMRIATDPCLSPDGARFVCRTLDGVVSLDLSTFEETRHARYALFAPGPDGRLAGMEPGGPLELHDPGAPPVTVPLAGDPIQLAWTADPARVLVLASRRVLRVDPATTDTETVFTASPGEELRDLRVRSDGTLDLALRRVAAGRSAGWRISLAPDGRVLDRGEERTLELPRLEDAGRTTPSIPWPLQPNAQHPVGNTYNEYQNYGGFPYVHPGVDVFGSAGQHVYAVHAGVVKAVLTTGGDLYWRVAVADTVGNGTLPGYLYAHLVRSTIPVTVGQQIPAGQYLGDLVAWPIPDFTHTHLARIRDTGAQWSGGWMSIGNPHIHLQNQSDDLHPVFEPAQGSALLAFCANETSSYQSPNALHGAVDVIAHVGDRIVSDYVCTVQELRYTIYPAGHPGAPVVDDRLAVFFDMENDYYAGGSGYALLTDILYKQDATCPTQGDYDFREFYHILTNSDGDAQWGTEDQLASWDTSGLPDGEYVIRVLARDAAGNATTDSMTVRTANGNPSSLDDDVADVLRLASAPNPVTERAAIRFSLRSGGRVSLAIYDPAGRRVRSLLDAALPAGAHEVEWDGRGALGERLESGCYFYRLAGPDGTRSARLVVR